MSVRRRAESPDPTAEQLPESAAESLRAQGDHETLDKGGASHHPSVTLGCRPGAHNPPAAMVTLCNR